MQERVKKIRKYFDITQQEFADRIGIKRGTIANYEVGRNEPTDSVISLICREFNVNENWLRTGEGDMFLPADRENEISKAVKSLLDGEPDSFKSRFITMLAGLSVSDWERLEKEARKLLDNIGEKHHSTVEATRSPTVEEAEAAYIKSRSKIAQKAGNSALSTTADTEPGSANGNSLVSNQ